MFHKLWEDLEFAAESGQLLFTMEQMLLWHMFGVLFV